MPYLWSDERLKREFGDSHEVKKLVRVIKGDIREMYDDIMEVLIEDHADIFAPAMGDGGEVDVDGNGDGDEDSEGWMFSFERFEWAFAMVNSRHWHLPLQDLDDALMQLKRIKEDPDPAEERLAASSVDAVDATNTMPANQPTDEYVSQHDEAIKREHIEEYVVPTAEPLSESISAVSKHSFMAPL